MPKFDVKAQVTNELNFKPDATKNNGLCIGNCNGVEVTYSDAERNTGDGEYGHMSLPQIVFHFEQKKDDKGDPSRVYNHRERVINSLFKDGNEVEEKTINGLYQAIFFRLKHMYDVMGGTSLNQKELDAVTPDEHSEPEERIAKFGLFFEYWAKLFNEGNNGKPLYKNKTYTMKIIADYVNRKYFGFPTFVKQGFIEEYRQKNGKLDTILEIKPDESIELGKGKDVVADDGISTAGLPQEVLNLLGTQPK